MGAWRCTWRSWGCIWERHGGEGGQSEADMPGGVRSQRTVSENCKTLKFKSHGFEKD